MKTDLLYYKDHYRREFSARIVRVEKEKSTWCIILDQTFFYPEGGGQPADSGYIGNCRIVNVTKKGGIVFHFTPDEPEEKQGLVHCSLDWSHRYEYMQQHTGQHIISGVLYKEGIQTVSVHQGEQYTAIETDSASLSDDDLERIEEKVNLLIARNLDVLDYQVSDADIPSLNLRRAPKVKGIIRIVELDGYDRVACGGIHTRTTGEVLFAKVLFTEKIRGHVRIAWVLGNRILSDYRLKQRIAQRLSDLFSVPPDGIVSAAEKLLEENKSLKKRVESLLTGAAAREVVSLLDTAEMRGLVSVAVKEYHVDDKAYLKRIMSVLPGEKQYAVCLVNRYGNDIQWVLAVTVDGFNFNAVRGELLSPISGKGGGKAPFYQGVGTNPDGINTFFETFRKLFSSL